MSINNFDASSLPNGKASLYSGIYFYSINAGEFNQVRKMMLLR